MAQGKVLIAGAGISGLAAAVACAQKGIPFRIIERKPRWEQRGYAMTLQGEGIAAAEALGILTAVRQSGVVRTIERIETSRGKLITSIEPVHEGESYTITRSFLHSVLAEKVSYVEFGTVIEHISPSGRRHHVRFSNGTADTFDLIIGADGINSPLRSRLNSGSCIQYSGLGVWNVMAGHHFPNIIEIWGNHSIIAYYPLKEGVSVSFFAEVPDSYFSSTAERRNDILSRFGKYGTGRIALLLKNSEADIFFGSVRNVTAPRWFDKGIILIGDAAHGVSPLSGMGANLALADAVGVADILSTVPFTDSRTLQRDLLAFTKKRKTKALRALKRGEKRKKRALMKAPFSWIRNYAVKSRPWIY